MAKRILLASNNGHKVVEYREILGPLGFEILTPKDLGISVEPEENGSTYAENAYIKAKALAELVDIPVVSDDSGIEISAYGGAPGIHSARYAKSLGGDYDRVNRSICEDVSSKSDKKAEYRCCICFLNAKDGKPRFFEGTCKGTILEKPSGHSGFGYDPIFLSDEKHLRFGTCSEEEKNSVSHRHYAAMKLAEFLKGYDGGEN